MGKIVSNILIVSIQLIVGGLFLFILFSDEEIDNSVVVNNNNLNKMADTVLELFVAEDNSNVNIDLSKEEALIDAEAKRREEELALAEQKRLEEEEKKREEEERKEEEIGKLEVIDTSGYTSKPALGFNVTTDNKVYELSDEDFATLARVVSCEANKSSKDDILAVMSVILNRTDSSRYPNDPVAVVAAPGQFSCYKMSVNRTNDLVESVIRDALNGIRNNDYYGFRSWESTSYSNNYIVERGNRYS